MAFPVQWALRRVWSMSQEEFGPGFVAKKPRAPADVAPSCHAPYLHA